MKYHIEQVKIEGFWKRYILDVNLKDDANIFIGKNGSGKTTFINILQACLTLDVELLSTIEFESVRFTLLSKNRKHRTIVITKDSTPPVYDTIKYKIGNKKAIEFPLYSRDIEYNRKRHINLKYEDVVDNLRKQMNSLVSVSWLSVHREIMGVDEYERIHRKGISGKNPVDRRLSELMNRFTNYQLQLETEAGSLNKKMLKAILMLMLFDKRFDEWQQQMSERLDPEEAKQGLVHAYKELGVYDTNAQKLITEHISKITQSLSNIDKSQKENQTSLNINDVLPISLYRRTQNIVNISTTYEDQKSDLFYLISTYLGMLRNFIKTVTFSTSPERGGGLDIFRGEKPLSIEMLSSGEKQLIILLTEALLQKSQNSVFIADEPELSLHIDWQRKLLSSIRDLNSNAQIIVATHSPEIAGAWRTKLIKMEDIIHG